MVPAAQLVQWQYYALLLAANTAGVGFVAREHCSSSLQVDQCTLVRRWVESRRESATVRSRPRPCLGSLVGSGRSRLILPGIVLTSLDASGISALNAAIGGLLAVGGAITTTGGATNEVVFAFTVGVGSSDVRQLRLEVEPFVTAVPEPASMLLLGTGLAARSRLRRKQ